MPRVSLFVSKLLLWWLGATAAAQFVFACSMRYFLHDDSLTHITSSVLSCSLLLLLAATHKWMFRSCAFSFQFFCQLLHVGVRWTRLIRTFSLALLVVASVPIFIRTFGTVLYLNGTSLALALYQSGYFEPAERLFSALPELYRHQKDELTIAGTCEYVQIEPSVAKEERMANAIERVYGSASLQLANFHSNMGDVWKRDGLKECRKHFSEKSRQMFLNAAAHYQHALGYYRKELTVEYLDSLSNAAFCYIESYGSDVEKDLPSAEKKNCLLLFKEAQNMHPFCPVSQDAVNRLFVVGQILKSPEDVAKWKCVKATSNQYWFAWTIWSMPIGLGLLLAAFVCYRVVLQATVFVYETALAKRFNSSTCNLLVMLFLALGDVFKAENLSQRMLAASLVDSRAN